MPDAITGRLMDIVMEIAWRAPAKQGSYVHSAQIPWSLIHDLRKELDALGIEWRIGD